MIKAEAIIRKVKLTYERELSAIAEHKTTAREAIIYLNKKTGAYCEIKEKDIAPADEKEKKEIVLSINRAAGLRMEELVHLSNILYEYFGIYPGMKDED